MESLLSQINNRSNGILHKVFADTSIMRAVIILVIAVYAAKWAPALPQEIALYFDNKYFKLIMFTIIIWSAKYSPLTSLSVAFGFIIFTNYINKAPLWEFLDNVSPTPMVSPMISQMTKETAIKSVVDTINQTTPQVVTSMTQNATTVVQPAIVSGQVVNPNIVIAPIVVSTPQGDKLIVTPDVTVIKPATTPTHTHTHTHTHRIQQGSPQMSTDAVPSKPSCYSKQTSDMTKVRGLLDGVPVEHFLYLQQKEQEVN